MSFAAVAGTLSGTGTTGNKTVSGLTDPKAVIVRAVNRTAAGTSASTDPTNFSYGVGTYRGGTASAWCIGWSAESGDPTAVHTAQASASGSTICQMLGNNDHDVATPTTDFAMTLVSMDATSVTFNISNAHTAGAIIIDYLILCGTDITDAQCGVVTTVGSTTLDTTVASGFGKPDLICIGSIWENFANIGNAIAQCSIGWGTDSTEQVVSNSVDVDAAGSVLAGSMQLSNNSKILQTLNATPAADYNAALAAKADWPTDGFRLTFSATTADDFGWLALKGTFQKKVGAITSPGGTGNQDTNIDFPGAGAMFWGASQVSGTSIVTAQTTAPRLVSQFVGFSDGTTESAAGWSDDDANANQRARAHQSTTQSVVMQSNSGGTVSITGAADHSWSSNNLRLNWSAVPSAAREILYVAIGAAPTSGTIFVTITAALETDAAQALDKDKLKSLGVASETDAAQALDKDKIKVLGFASESDTAQAFTKFKRVNISAALETDAAVALTKKKTVVIIPATETDSAVAITFTQGGGGAQFITITAATETDAAQALKVVKKPTITPATETDLAQALTKLKRLGIVPASETDAAQALRAYHPRTITPAGETDSAVALTKRKQVTITPASETDAAQLLKVVKRLSITPANETDAAQLLRHFKLLTLGIASEVDAAQALTKQKRVTISPALEFDIAVPLTIAGETVTIVYRYRGPIRIGRF